ncbi:AraC family transcriptional regulator [Wenyingzhuangia aestuarii]|uniref:AraC family transcriptional regulator n=1 Tax=Wenyingzhuangia aestuarii TaxID=1647582 RepID=UPI00143ACB82|nr:AraC family transcriptional regulator [Wenyingzhuangia aestuarii]NJB83436.1 YesN/AraC family two-component response regulator [Wenyingzhuangia aestuarii]
METDQNSKKIVVSLEKIEKKEHASFHTGVYKQQYFNGDWHYHPEFELLLIKEGEGTRLVGDHGEKFEVNDLVLLGSFLPHAWITDADYLKEQPDKFCESIYVQFKKNIFGSSFVNIPELKGVRKILRLSERGLKINGKHKDKIISLLEEMPKENAFNQLIKLLKILNLVSISDYTILASENYLKENFQFKSHRMLKIHEYLMENYKQNIDIKTCADMANMTLPSFCRYFKNETNMIFSDYLNHIRIDFSKRLLTNTDMAIKEIGYECGYNSVPYFNKQFKKIAGESPFKFRKISREKH